MLQALDRRAQLYQPENLPVFENSVDDGAFDENELHSVEREAGPRLGLPWSILTDGQYRASMEVPLNVLSEVVHASNL
ncbi:hypothetical protein [Mesorhizobium sp. Root102]|uniref:hypothetical protein n=1 Tax=Mesorhizobium sp. Root102 TaxID=1736422 RepID=UPI0012E3E825|nr:hypothetical protein [Mesorhizobium sp. Root102]